MILYGSDSFQNRSTDFTHLAYIEFQIKSVIDDLIH